jgi:hypothetical protein
VLFPAYNSLIHSSRFESTGSTADSSTLAKTEFIEFIDTTPCPNNAAEERILYLFSYSNTRLSIAIKGEIV